MPKIRKQNQSKENGDNIISKMNGSEIL